MADLAKHIQDNRTILNEWFDRHAQKAPPPFYCSIDLRDSGHKIVPVDSNLYPAGFNNICPEDLRTAPSIFRAKLEAVTHQRGLQKVHKIMILPESHTQNSFYIENLFYLQQLIQNADYDVCIGWYGPLPEGSTQSVELVSNSGKVLTAYPIRIEEGVLSVTQGNEKFTPDFILLNNDFSSAYPKPLDEVKQPIIPSHTLGWHSRKKSEHFKYYNLLAAEFAKITGIDPWVIQIDTQEVTPVNFSEDSGTEEVAKVVDEMLERTRQAYTAHQVDRKPFVFVKNNAGTYGMGIMVAHSSEDLRKMNRRTKNKMSVGKNHSPIESVVVQEGVPTATLVGRLAAEPVIYLFGTELIGGFLRTNTQKGDEDNLNSQGMVFRKLCMSDLRDQESSALSPGDTESTSAVPTDTELSKEPVMELVYGSIARISALATGMELAKHAREHN